MGLDFDVTSNCTLHICLIKHLHEMSMRVSDKGEANHEFNTQRTYTTL